MATAFDYHLNADPDRGRALAGDALRQQGFEVTTTANGSLLATRGSMPLTLLVGALAGSRMHVSFDVQVYSTETGSVVRLNRNLASGALKGGALGASRVADLFQKTAHELGRSLHEAQVLEQTTEVTA
jgi:hypothetical protein